MFSSVNAGTFVGGVKAGILTLSIILVIVGVNSASLTPFGLPRGFLLSTMFRVPWGPAAQFRIRRLTVPPLTLSLIRTLFNIIV